MPLTNKRVIPRFALLILSVLAILVATLRRGGSELPEGWSFALVSGDTAVAEAIQNLLLFIPLGVGLVLVGVRPVRAITLGAALSLSVEFAQQWIPGRDPSLGDIIWNTLSTAIGAALVLYAPRWFTVSPQRSAVHALVTACTALAIWLGTGILLRPLIPLPPYATVWTPDWSHFGRYRGRVIAASVPPFPLLMGAPLRLTILAPSRPPGRIAPLVAVVDARDTRVAILSADRTDLVLRYHNRAIALTLDQPDMRWYRALRYIAPQDTFAVQVWRGEHGICTQVESARRCGFGYTVGDGWRIIFFPEQFPPWIMTTLNVLWMAGLMLGVGYWSRRAANYYGGEILRRRETAAALAAVLVGLLVVPLTTGLKMTPLLEWLGAVGGIGAGWSLNRALKGRLGQSARP